jgi:Phosphopantetheine attachment site
MNPDLERDFWRLFSRVLGRPLEPGRYDTAQLPEWDSLRHVELMFELEEHFGISVPQGRIAALYSSTDAVLDFLRANGTAR